MFRREAKRHVGTWKVPVDILATSRFAISPRAEVVDERPGQGAQPGAARLRNRVRCWLGSGSPRARSSSTWSGELAGARGGGFGWMADFLAVPPPLVARATLEQGSGPASAPCSDEQIRADLVVVTEAPLAPRLLSPACGNAAVKADGRLWTHTIETDWTRRERVLRADIVARTDQLAPTGWGAVLRDLGHHREWVGNGEFADQPLRGTDRDTAARQQPDVHPAPPPRQLGRVVRQRLRRITARSPDGWPPSTPRAAPGWAR